ncbi:MAG TPA: hypothetical protein VFX15_00965 [Actinomycetes bacterium]|nr:hypothetical protein [Actinomycetes bacterium]
MAQSPSVYGDSSDLTTLLSIRRSSPIRVWVDPASPATGMFLPYLDVDGHSHGGRPYRFRGAHEIELRTLPDPTDELSDLVARCVHAVRAWAVQRNAGDQLVPMDYDVPWGYLVHLQRDLGSLRERGLPHLVATAGRDGEWLGDFVAEHFDAPEVEASVAEDRSLAMALGITTAPSVQVSNHIFRAEEMPDDIDGQVESLLHL